MLRLLRKSMMKFLKFLINPQNKIKRGENFVVTNNKNNSGASIIKDQEDLLISLKSAVFFILIPIRVHIPVRSHLNVKFVVTFSHRKTIYLFNFIFDIIFFILDH